MGNSESKPTPEELAIYDVKKQRDKLKRYSHNIQTDIENGDQTARRCVAAGDKPGALLALRKKKFQASLKVKVDAQYDTMWQLAHDMEMALKQKATVESIRIGTKALKQIQDGMGVEAVEKLMEETAEAMGNQEAISNLLANNLTPMDTDEVDDELEALEKQMAGKEKSTEQAKNEKAAKENSDTEAQMPLPNVPTTELPTKQRERVEAREQEEERQAMLA